ncbi:unnamed protein product [Lepeophtheirus salmonis]|uniref:(salmon louse) hypothetical protein n=1 Tax=Lepeophtheirus salmonis TaxID=72036 RepID=A0A7R8H547_LEPSM|nr:unnamed protein product [Lepeophtheirus salmonis]CAF2861380.1 unnamed protein product [Lepeophtheirus salmonis]
MEGEEKTEREKYLCCLEFHIEGVKWGLMPCGFKDEFLKSPAASPTVSLLPHVTAFNPSINTLGKQHFVPHSSCEVWTGAAFTVLGIQNDLLQTMHTYCILWVCRGVPGTPRRNSQIDTRIQELRSVQKALRSKPFIDENKSILCGHSFGAATILALLHEDPSVYLGGVAYDTWVDPLSQRQAVLDNAHQIGSRILHFCQSDVPTVVKNARLLPYLLRGRFDFERDEKGFDLSVLAFVHYVRNKLLTTDEGNETKNTHFNDFIEEHKDFIFKGCKFPKSTVIQFWVCVKQEYPDLGQGASEQLQPFASAYLCEASFSAMDVLRTKQRNKMILEKSLITTVASLPPRLNKILCGSTSSRFLTKNAICIQLQS